MRFTKYNFIFVLVAALAFPGALRAQQTHVDEISIDTRATIHQQTTEGVYDSHFQGDYFNLHILGHLTDNLSFRIRQRFNKRIDDRNPFNATDFLWLRWQATQRWAFTAGKQPILLGGYEIDAAPIDVYYYGAFTNNLYQYYAFGISAHYTPAPGQTLTLQFCPSPISPAEQNSYSYNLHWNGRITPVWRTLWSINYVEDEFHRMMNHIVLGNKFQFDNFFFDIDLINRASAKQERFFFTDWSLIGKVIWTVGKWNLCTKVGYERNDAANVDANGLSFDLTLPAGHDYLYYGAGVEFFPLGDDNLRLHAVYFRDNHDTRNNFDLGITWRFKLYKRS